MVNRDGVYWRIQRDTKKLFELPIMAGPWCEIKLGEFGLFSEIIDL
jgi:hypothetical protein